MKETIKIKEELFNLIDRLNYEVISNSNVIATLIENSQDKEILEGDLFQKYNKEYISSYVEYDLAKQQINKFLLERFPGNDSQIDWNLDFFTGELELDVVKGRALYQNKVTIDVDEDTITKIENLHYSVLAMRDIIIKLFDRHKLDVDTTKLIESKVLKEYQRQLTQIERQYEKEKDRVSTLLMPDEYKGVDGITWNINFLDNQFELYFK